MHILLIILLTIFVSYLIDALKADKGARTPPRVPPHTQITHKKTLRIQSPSNKGGK